ncbi:MAG TPA: hypothetical protein VK738_07590 [Terriglobales bacterium]|jgi:hypothetical protein|nr:hypothetical protein [Terriglobales bacterium]
MNITQWVAGVGACTGVASLSWNIYLKLSSGPKLCVQAWAGMVKRPAPPGDPKYLKVSIQNIGTAPTTLTNYGFYQYASEKDRSRHKPETAAVLNIYQGAVVPYRLAVGDEATIFMEHNLEFDRALQKGVVYFWISHAFAKNPIEVPIFSPPKE